MKTGSMVVGVLAAALALTSGLAWGQPSPDPMPILQEVAKQYAEMRTYHFASKMVVKSADGSPTKEIEQVLAGAPEGKNRLEMGNASGRVIAVSDGKTDWTYTPSSNKYITGVGGSQPAPALSEQFARSYSTVDRDLVRATWLRAESLTLGTESVVCDVILVVPQTGRPAVANAEADRLWRTEWMGVPRTYWVDRRFHRILREVAVSEKGGRIETNFSIARINEELPADLFVSPVPPGAKKANEPR